MKKLLCVLLTAGLLCLGVSAAQYEDVFEMMTDWEQNGYPADVAGICSTDGSADHITILLVGDDDGSRAAEISAMLEDSSTITFGVGSYSESDLRVVRDEIADAFVGKEDSGINSVGIGWGKDGGFGSSGNELRVVVTAEPDRVDEYAEMFYEHYADMVVVEAGGRVYYIAEDEPDLATELPEAAPENDIYGDLADGPVAAPAAEMAPDTAEPAPDTDAPASAAAPASDVLSPASPEPQVRSGGGLRALWLAVPAAALVLAAVLLLRRKKKH